MKTKYKYLWYYLLIAVLAITAGWIGLQGIRDIQSLTLNSILVVFLVIFSFTLIIISLILKRSEEKVKALRENFISMVVHELRSPLSNITKVLELFSQGILKPGSKDYQEMIEMTLENTRKTRDLINELLDVAKMESGEFEIHPEPANIKEVIADRVRFYELAAKEKELTLRTAFASNLPENFLLDPARISQVFNNLISNSLKFTKAGGIITFQAVLHKKGQSLYQEARNAQIEWFLHGDDKNLQDLPDSLILAVTDTGVGIAEKNLPKLFGRFKQFHPDLLGSGQRGTGLGLYIAKGIVQAHHGIIGVASEEGIGSTFYFILPFPAGA